MIFVNELAGTITLDDFYYIDVDALNWILKDVKVVPPTDRRGNPNKNAGNRCDTVIGYYPSLQSALTAYVNCTLQDAIQATGDSWSIDELKDLLKGINESILNI